MTTRSLAGSLVWFMVLGGMVGGASRAQAQERPPQPTTLERVLQEDGLLHLISAPAKARSTAPTAQDDGWSEQFSLPGLDFRGEAVAVIGDEVYVGGAFEAAGTATNTASIARWNTATQAWSALGDSLSDAGVFEAFSVPGSVSALAAQGSRLYVGGTFAFVGGGTVAARNIAVWEAATGTWSSLGAGTDGTVLDIEVSADGGSVFVAGAFASAGGRLVNHVAVWNTTTQTWSSLAAGMDDTVWALERVGNDLYAGGTFTVADGQTVNGLARWNGNGWTPVQQDGVPGVSQGIGAVPGVLALASDGTDLFLGGDFMQAGGQTVRNVARWNISASTFNLLGDGFSTPGPVYGLRFSGSTLFAAGSFAQSGGVAVNQVAAWRGTRWEALGAGLQGDDFEEAEGLIRGLAVSGDRLYVAGTFTEAGGKRIRGLAQWDEDSGTWNALGAQGSGLGLLGKVDYFADQPLPPPPPLGLASASSGDAAYIGGEFKLAGDIVAHSIARWDVAAERWSALGTGVVDEDGDPGLVRAVAVHGERVYVGGRFVQAGGIPANNVAVWDGTTGAWAALGDGVNRTVRALTVSADGNSVFAGGLFTEAGEQAINYLARWDVPSASWSGLPGGILGGVSPAFEPGVRAFEWIGDALYVAGNFTQINGQAASFVARWEGGTWEPVLDGSANGVDDLVIDLATDGADLWLAGAFEVAGGTVVNGVARWRVATQTFEALGRGFDDVVTTLAVDANGTFYAGGAFTESGSDPSMNRIGRWIESEQRWSRLGRGANRTVWAIAPLEANDLLVAGLFDRAGVPAAFAASRYTSTANLVPVATDDLGVTRRNTSVALDVLANDTDLNGDLLVVVAIVEDPSDGTADIIDDGQAVRYTPDTSFVGVDMFRYRVSDGRGGESEAMVTVSVTEGANVAPTATDDVAVTQLNTPVAIDVLANDTDLNGDPLTVIAIVEDPAGGVAERINNAQSIRYTPHPGFAGLDTFRYRVSDGQGGEAEAAVSVSVVGETVLQLIHNAPLVGIVDIYLNGIRVVDDLDYRQATPYLDAQAGETVVDITEGGAPDNSTPILSTTVVLEPLKAHVAIATGGGVQDFSLVLKKDAQIIAEEAGTVAFFLSHGVLDIEEMDIELLDPANDNLPVALLAEDFAFGDVSDYVVRAPQLYNLGISLSGVFIAAFRLDLSSVPGQALTVLASGQLIDGTLAVIGFDAGGQARLSQVVTAAEQAEEVPRLFAVHSNYPNPFHSTTTIRFDLPERAEVSVEIVDMLGRQMLTTATQAMDAGANRSLTIEASGWASGTYLYRVLVRTSTRTQVAAGRMLVLK